MYSILFFIIVAVVAQTYSTDAHKVYVIVGNSALVKCEIPSFVSDFVSVVSWVENNGLEYFPNHIGIFIFFSLTRDHLYMSIEGDTVSHYLGQYI